jgi:hypothetical protein
MARNCQNHLGDHQRYKETYFTAFQANISLVTELYVMKWGITELQAVSMTLLSFQVTTWETAPIEDAINEHPVAESL